MPTDSLLVAIGVCFIFLLFAFVVAWVDHTTSQWLGGSAAAKQPADATQSSDKRAA